MATTELLLSPSTGKSPAHSKSYIKVLCFVGVQDDRETQNLILMIKQKWPDTEIVYNDTGVSMLQEKDVVFFFKDFCGEAFEKIAEHNTHDKIGTRIVGPPYIKSRLILDGGELFSPKIKRPLFSVQMNSVVVCLSQDLGKERKRLAKYIQYMGGRVKKELQESIRPATSSQKACVYVGKELGKVQRTASLLQMKTLKPEWVDFCWAKRNDANLNVLDKELMREYAMGAFEGLRIALVGFAESECSDMIKNIAPNGGIHVTYLNEATHIVCDPNAPELSSLMLQDHQIAVTDAWFWQSINSLRCLNEEDYFLNSYPTLCRAANAYFGKVKSTNSLADCERSKGSDDFSSDDLDAMSPVTRTPNTPNTPKSPKGYDKRQQVILEILETERNYVTALNLALKFRVLIEEEWISKEGENPITRADLQMIFGKIGPIISVHNSILEKVQAHVNAWDIKNTLLGTPPSRFTKQNASDLAEIWISEKEKLLAAYPPYLNTYENGKAVFETADQKSTRFHVFIRSKESDPSFNRNKLIDLLIRPVQRLPSVILLLKELQKRTIKQEQVKRLNEAATAVDEILRHANTVRFKADCKIAHLARFTDMDKVPDHLVCSRRQFISEMDAISIAGTGDFNKWHKVDVRILLFNDVCKTRDQINNTSPSGPIKTPGGTLSRLRKYPTLSHIRKTYKKPLKYIKHIPIQYIRDIRELREVNDDGGYPTLYTSSNGVPLQVITIREDTFADIVWVIHPHNKSHMETTFKYIHQHVQMEYARNVYSQTPYPLNDLLAMSEVDEPLSKYLKKIVTASQNASTLNYTMSRGGSMLRRAISSASMSVANRLSRMATSRSNLREIMEAPSSQEGESTRGSAVTPLYNINPRLGTLYSSPNLLDSTQCTTPKRGLKERISTIGTAMFRKPSFRQRPMSPSFEENKEN